MRQRIDTDAELADAVGLLEQLAIDAARPQHERSGKASDAAPDDDCFHALLHSLLQPRPACGERSDRPCDPGEGVPHSRRAQLVERAPHPCPLPAKGGEREVTGRACHPAYSAASGFVASALSSARVFGLPLILRSSKSCRSRTLLRNICSLPGTYCGGQAISAPYQAAARIVNDGSTRCGRASATRSARPAARMVLTWSAVVMLPTHMVATRASLRTCSENGVWNIRP